MRPSQPTRPYSLGALALAAHTSPSLGQTEVWFTEVESMTFDSSSAVSTDGAGGAYHGTLVETQFVSPGNVLISRFDPTGQLLWSDGFGADGEDSVNVLVPDGVEGVFAAGFTTGDLFGTGNARNDDAWLARYDGVGNQLWVRPISGAGVDAATGGTPDGAGGLFLCGRTGSDLGSTNAGEQDAWLSRFDAQGQELWTLQLGTSTFDAAIDVTTDGQGGVFVTGLTFGSLAGPSFGSTDVWFGRVDSAGTLV